MNVLLSVIDPVAISIGPIKIYWYGIIIALAMLIGISLATKEAQKLGLEEDTMVDMALWAIPIGFIGARLYYVLFKWDYYIQNPSEIIAIWNGGIAIYGGLIAGGLAVYWFARRKKMLNSIILSGIFQISKSELEEIFNSHNISLNSRAEEISIEDYALISNAIHKKHIK